MSEKSTCEKCVKHVNLPKTKMLISPTLSIMAIIFTLIISLKLILTKSLHTDLASQLRTLSVLQQPVMKQAHYGGSVILHCTVITDRCAEEHSVYWFRHNSRESHPGVIYTHGDSNGWCKKKTTDSPTQKCIYRLPKTNLSLSDAGTYYCAVAACGEILFGNGTKLHVDITGGFSVFLPKN